MQATEEASSEWDGRSESLSYERVKALATGSAVVVFGSRDCCMCHVANHLLVGLGVAPTMVELDSLPEEVVSAVIGSGSGPAVFVGGRLLGGIESLMACHITGSLVPLLKDAGALWL